MNTNDSDRESCRALALAVLECALFDLKIARLTRNRKLEGEVEKWIGSNSDSWVFDFVPLCQWLGFDVDAMRRKLKNKP